MDPDKVERLLERYTDGLSDSEALAKIRPEVRQRLDDFATGQLERRRSRRVIRLSLFGVASAALAACLIFLIYPRDPAFGLRVRDADRSNGGSTRAPVTTAICDRFRITVDVDTPCWIHLVERTVSGKLHAIRPTPKPGVHAVWVESQRTLGPFFVDDPGLRDEPATLSHLLVIASANPITDASLESDIPDVLAPGRDEAGIEQAFQKLAETWQHQFGWEAQIHRIDTRPNGSR